MSKRRCIVAGFGPFAGLPVNHSEEIVQSLPDTIGENMMLEKFVLPTCCEQAWQIFGSKLSEGFDLALITGAIKGSGELLIERFGLNIRDYAVGDIAGHRWQGMQIYEDQPAAYMTNIDLTKLSIHLTIKGFPCRISNHAGTFVCNETYFRALCHSNANPMTKSVLLIHLPFPEDFAKKVQSLDRLNEAWKLRSRSEQLDYMRTAIIDIVEFCCPDLSHL